MVHQKGQSGTRFYCAEAFNQMSDGTFDLAHKKRETTRVKVCSIVRSSYLIKMCSQYCRITFLAD